MNDDTEPVLPPEIARTLAARRRRGERACIVCGTPFVGTERARYCSRACAARADYERHGEQRRAAHRARYQNRRAGEPAAPAAPGAPTVIDPAALAGFDAESVADIIALFFQEAPQYLTTLRVRLASDDVSGLKREAHALKGVAGSLGARQVQELAAYVERAAGTGSTQGIAEMLTQLERAFAQARTALRAVRI